MGCFCFGCPLAVTALPDGAALCWPCAFAACAAFLALAVIGASGTAHMAHVIKQSFSQHGTVHIQQQQIQATQASSSNSDSQPTTGTDRNPAWCLMDFCCESSPLQSCQMRLRPCVRQNFVSESSKMQPVLVRGECMLSSSQSQHFQHGDWGNLIKLLIATTKQ